MSSLQTFRVLGISSGSALDGVDASIIVTDGVDVFDICNNYEFPFDEELRSNLIKLHKIFPNIDENEKNEIEAKYTDFCIAAIKEILEDDNQINLIGFGGHIICHKPQEHILCQIGDNKKMAHQCNITTIGRLRDADMLSGGMGAPLAAIYHAALSQKLPKPLVWIDIGGISALTYIGLNGELLAFDTGPGNAFINGWVAKHAGIYMDHNGSLAAAGHINSDVLSSLMRHKFLNIQPPKAVDKSVFDDKSEHLEGLSVEDGAATATAFVADSIIKAIKDFVPEKPNEVIICGGGAKNPTLMRYLRQRSEGLEICNSEQHDFSSQAIEAQAFGYLAVRRCNQMPTSYPFTTGAANEVIGGELYTSD